tara:strand:+ start:204 stop:833 length:630 start_codon:yes stop_codon:yes gene_type:complete
MSRAISSRLLVPAGSRLKEIALNTVLFPTSIPFASPDSDWCAPTVKEVTTTSKKWGTNLSFTHPESDFTYHNYLSNVPRSYTITEALAPSTEARVLTRADERFQIEHVNDAWTRLCGFSKEECLGKTLGMIQGYATDKDVVNDLVSLLQEGKPVDAVLANYNKWGRKFNNHLSINPVVCTESHKVTHFIGVLKEIPDKKYTNQYAKIGN